MLPSSAQGLVEFHEGQSFVKLGLYKAQFGGEIVRVVGEDLKIAGNTTAVAHVREARRVLCGSNQEFLLLTKLLGSAVRNQGIRNLAESPLDGLLIAEEELLLLSLVSGGRSIAAFLQ